MPRKMLSQKSRQEFYTVPSSEDELGRYYLLSAEDHDLIRTRRRPENRLGLAVHIALLRYPGFGYFEGLTLPPALIQFLADQVFVNPNCFAEYGARENTRYEHHALATAHLRLKPFGHTQMELATILATKAAEATDHGVKIVANLIEGLRDRRFVLPKLERLERLAEKGRARARREAAISLFDALSASQQQSLQALLINDQKIGQTRLTWLRGYPHSTSPASMNALLERLKFLRDLKLPTDLGQNLHPFRLKKFADEGAIAPVSLLNDFGDRRRIATIAAQIIELQIKITDASIQMFERLTGQLYSRSKNAQDEIWRMGKVRVGKLMQLFGEAIDVMSRASGRGNDPFAALDDEIGWQKLLKSREEILHYSTLATEDPLTQATQKYVYLRKFAPAFLDVFEFSTSDAESDLQEALAILRDQNQSGKRILPEKLPMPFSAKHWQKLIYDGTKPKRRIYETAVITTLRERLRAGDVWVDGSREYQSFDSYLTNRSHAEKIMQDKGFEIDPEKWLEKRRTLLDTRLAEVDHALKRQNLSGVRIERGRLKITPHESDIPIDAERLERAIDKIMPRIRITDLLWEVNLHTGFLGAFTDLRSSKNHEEPAAVLAAILAGASNLGLERMAYASSKVSHAQLIWAQNWYLRPECFSDALARIIDAHHDLSFAQNWGKAEQSSSDGQFFAANRGSGLINAKYGLDPGIKIYSFLSGQYGSFHSSVIGATAGEAPFVLDGILGNPASFDPLIHYTDTGGASDHVFALFHLLGLEFAPRLRDFPDRRLACFGKASKWKTLAPTMGKPINEDVIRKYWGDIIRLAASLHDKSLKPSTILRKLGSYRQQNRLYLALGEIGRIERTLFMLDWIENAELRMECQAGLNKGEARHSLARAVFAHSQGRIHDRSEAAQQKRAMALNLVIAAITFWNTLYMDKATKNLLRTSPFDPSLLKHTSPLGWEHIILSGDFDWHSGATERKISRPLNINPRRMWRT